MEYIESKFFEPGDSRSWQVFLAGWGRLEVFLPMIVPQRQPRDFRESKHRKLKSLHAIRPAGKLMAVLTPFQRSASSKTSEPTKYN
jgi:hypothetical protein